MGNVNEEYVKSLTFALANFRLQVNYLLRNFFAYSAPLDSLEILGRDRNTPRLPNETEGDYRPRVEDAWNQNVNIGSAESIHLRMDSLGYIFNKYIAGDTTEGEGSYNLIVRSRSTEVHDGSRKHDGAIKHDQPGANDIRIELVMAGSITAAIEAAIRGALNPILRASSRLYISKINP